MTWRQSLIRISTYEVEVMQKRLAEVVDRRTHAEMRLAVLEAEAEAEMDHARRDGDAAMRLGRCRLRPHPAGRGHAHSGRSVVGIGRRAYACLFGQGRRHSLGCRYGQDL